MTDRRGQKLPQARKDGLLIEMLPDEVLVYDLDRKKAHCLNQTAGLIWNHCDGQTSVEEMAIVLQQHSNARVDQDVVWFGLDQLRRARLIETPLVTPTDKSRLSRRELVKRIGLTVSIPLVLSILAPKASAAASCVGINCVVDPSVCSPNCTCNGTTCQ